ncbi:MAG: hypothetical protein BGO26_09885 [Actinobacteria bacterium 69-20]|jgi:antitoxin (DNA-binding transcriptional repressor) of toxin-antitoxin stability system|nr:MAG: hypothetical protein BGO26_09885 [Actinobacteria bacterium 69-20]
MRSDAVELSVSEARDRFSDAVNRATFGGEITYITRGRGHRRAAAIVPAEFVEQYEAMLDAQDGRIASERLGDLEAGRTQAVPDDDLAAIEASFGVPPDAASFGRAPDGRAAHLDSIRRR